MIRVVIFFICMVFVFLSSASSTAQINAGAGTEGIDGSEMKGEFPSLGSLSVKSGSAVEDITDAAWPRTINKRIVYRANELDDESSSKIIAFEGAKREIIEELKNDVMSLYREECELNNAEPSFAYQDIISLMAPLLYIETSDEKWEKNQLEFTASATVSSFAIAQTLFILSDQEMLLKHIKKNQKSADQALAKIDHLQGSPSDNNKERQESYNKTVNLLHSTQLFEQALLSGLAGEMQSAIDDYTKAVELNPEYSEAYYHRGSHYYSYLKDNRKALRDFNRAIKLDDSEPEYFSSRGICYYDMNNLALAMKDFNRVIELDPTPSLLYTAFAFRGNVYEKRGEDRKALQDYTQAIEINPKAVNIYFRKGVLNRRLKNYEESVEDFDNVIKLDAKHSDAYHERGIAYAFLGDKQKVLNDFKSAARLGNAEAQEFLSSKNIKWEE